MISCNLAGKDIYFANPASELKPFERANVAADEAVTFAPHLFRENELISRTEGWVAGAQRLVEVYDSTDGLVLKVAGGSEFLIASQEKAIGKLNSPEELSPLDREILLGPVLVLALALRGVWSLHASAAMYQGKVIVFLGESGQGKSTLAAYLSQNPDWRLVADDILPVTSEPSGVVVWPHFPQLKLPMQAQPAVGLPEQLPLKYICVLTHAEPDQMPELQKISATKTVKALLSHIAGTRMFGASLLAKHLEFSAQVGKQIPTYRLIHPHRRDTLPLVKGFLEKIC